MRIHDTRWRVVDEAACLCCVKIGSAVCVTNFFCDGGLQTYERARALIAEPARGCFVFSNEHHSGTYIERQADESPNDRNDRAIRKAAWWYSTHFQALQIPVVLVTNDLENKRKAEAMHIQVRVCVCVCEHLGEKSRTYAIW
jgi:hypothetical protein